MTSVLAFLLIALLQNSERRYDEALHRKIDALAIGVAHLLESEQADDGDRAGAERLRGTSTSCAPPSASKTASES